MSLSHELNNELFAYIIGFIKNKNCFPYRINAMEDHIHILFDLHPNIALADFMRDIKTSTSFWLKQKSKYPNFEGWADGYAALTYSFRDKEMIINYIKNQQKHHKKESFKEELRRLLEEQGVKIDERFFPYQYHSTPSGLKSGIILTRPDLLRSFRNRSGRLFKYSPLPSVSS